MSLFVWSAPYSSHYPGHWIEGPYLELGEEKAEARALLYVTMLNKRGEAELRLIGPYRTRKSQRQWER